MAQYVVGDPNRSHGSSVTHRYERAFKTEAAEAQR
jgi:hypothetical protein